MAQDDDKPVQNTDDPRARSLANLTPPFPPGVSGNPAGRPKNAGLSILEIVNDFIDRDVPARELRRIAKDDDAPPRQRTAAIRVLRMMELPDFADIEPLLDGQLSLRELRAQGYDTGTIKKCKTKRRVLKDGDGNITGEEVERELELHDRSGEEFDRVCDRTHGKPTQPLDVKHDGHLRTNADGQAAADQAITALQAALGT